tara:strand:- start:324 stop:434 length:111 start_codon:yes stop_codon:yes gene_type:complete
MTKACPEPPKRVAFAGFDPEMVGDTSKDAQQRRVER